MYIRADDLEDWAERCWPRLSGMGYHKRCLELALEGASEAQQDAEGYAALRVWRVEGILTDEYDTDGDIVIAEAAEDITAEALAALERAGA